MNGFDLGTVSEVVVILAALFTFALWYDRKVTHVGTRGEGFIWLQVVLGVFVTLIAMGLLDWLLPWNAFFIGLLAFSVSGAPMSWGAYQRSVKRCAGQRRL